MIASRPDQPLFLGIEIGGTKLQVGLGHGAGALIDLERRRVEPERGAAGIRAQIRAAADELLRRHGATPTDLAALGIGFGGPVDAARGIVLLSNQITGWTGFPLAAWAREQFGGVPVVVQNDAATAALGEARAGAGVGHDPVLYLTIGSGIGGGLIVAGAIYRGSGRGAIEIGHLRLPDPGWGGPAGDSPAWASLEDMASGWAIGRAGRELVARTQGETDPEAATSPLVRLCSGQPDAVTAELVASAAIAGDEGAAWVLQRARTALGQALAHAVNLLAPERIILGGGVSLIAADHWLIPIRQEVATGVFAPFQDRYEVVTARLGEAVVVHGALALAGDACSSPALDCKPER